MILQVWYGLLRINQQPSNVKRTLDYPTLASSSYSDAISMCTVWYVAKRATRQILFRLRNYIFAVDVFTVVVTFVVVLN